MESLHTGGHVSQKDIQMMVGKVNPDMVIPIHIDNPNVLKEDIEMMISYRSMKWACLAIKRTRACFRTWNLCAKCQSGKLKV